jgi:hypothetical protein
VTPFAEPPQTFGGEPGSPAGTTWSALECYEPLSAEALEARRVCRERNKAVAFLKCVLPGLLVYVLLGRGRAYLSGAAQRLPQPVYRS